jgi:phosphate transport system substrate-binding protein
MFARLIRCQGPRLAIAVALATATAGCRGEAPVAAAAVGPLAGRVSLEGSSTLQPVSLAMTTAFGQANPGVLATVHTSGTGGGLKKLCEGAVDIAEASRPINAVETEQCKSRGIEFIELPVAFDSLTVVANPKNRYLRCLTVGELKTLWEPGAAGKITRWNQVRSAFPAEPVALYGPGTDSGTYDYFTLAIVGTEHSGRGDYVKSEDDEVLVSGIAGDVHALGYFGYAYYLANKSRLQAVAVDGGHGCVLPSPDTLADNSYQPLTRPLFLYVSTRAAQRPEVRALAHFYLDPEHARYVHDVGYAPLPPATLLSVARRLDAGVTGSIFQGRGSVLGVTADAFREDDRIQNALVQ